MKKIIILALLILTLFSSRVVYANYGLDDTANEAGLTNAVRGGTPADIIGGVVGAGLTMVGVLFLLLMIYGGIIWMIARGNETQTDKALNTIKAAIIGLIIVVASYAITTFVFNAVSEKQTASPPPTGVCRDVLSPPEGCVAGVCGTFTSISTCNSTCCTWNVY